jgi:hypothetical protein
MNVYATTSDLTAWLTDLALTVPANAAGLLRSATVLVAKACARNPYTDVPDANAASILRDATTAQVAAWVGSGVTPATLGLDSAPKKSSKIGTADVTYDTTGQADKRETAATVLAPEAAQILIAGGLYALDVPQWIDPDTDGLPTYGLDSGRFGFPRPDIDSESLDALRPGVTVEVVEVIGY